MELKDVNSKWDEINKKEHDLETQLENIRQEKTQVFKEFVKNGFYQQDGKWSKNESCSTCRHFKNWSCLNGDSAMYLERVNPNGSCYSGWEAKL